MSYLAAGHCFDCQGNGYLAIWDHRELETRKLQCVACLEQLAEDALSRCGEHKADGCGCLDCALVDAISAAERELERLRQ